MRHFLRLSELDHREFYGYHSLRDPSGCHPLPIPEVPLGLRHLPDMRLCLPGHRARLHERILLPVRDLLPSCRQVHPDRPAHLRFHLLFGLLLLQRLYIQRPVPRCLRLPAHEDSQCDLL